MGSLPAQSPAAPAPQDCPARGRGGGRRRLHTGWGGGSSQRLAALVPQPLLKFAPPPRNKKINTEKEKETHKTGILGTQPMHSLRPSSAAAEKRVTTDARPSSGDWAPEPPSSRPPGPAAPTGPPTSGHTWRRDLHRQAV